MTCDFPAKSFPNLTAPSGRAAGALIRNWLKTAATSRRRVQRIPVDDREVPSPQTRKTVEASPLDPAADLAGALRGLPDRRGLRVVSRPEISQRFQKFALILRRTFPRHALLRISDHPPSRSPTVPPLLSFAATRCGDQVFLWRRSMRRFFCSLVAKTSQPQLSARLLENATNDAPWPLRGRAASNEPTRRLKADASILHRVGRVAWPVSPWSFQIGD